MRIRDFFALSETWLGRSHLAVWLADVVISAVSAFYSGYLSQIQGWQWAIVVLAAIGAFVLVFFVISGFILGLSWFFVARLIPLRVVARRIYEKSQGSTMGNVAERDAKTPDKILDFFANLVISSVDVYAKQLPSTKYTVLHPGETQMLKSTNGAKNLYEARSEAILYGSPHVRRADIKFAAGYVEALGGPI